MTNLSLDDVVALNALIVTAIGLTFVLGRKERKTPTLNLGGPRRPTALDDAPSVTNLSDVRKSRNEMVRSAPSRARSSEPAVGGEVYGAAALQRLEAEEAAPMPPAAERQLNVFFNWNGHTWDAFEVLGCPAGASRETVLQAFHACRAKSPDSIAFLQAATDAILKSR